MIRQKQLVESPQFTNIMKLWVEDSGADPAL